MAITLSEAFLGRSIPSGTSPVALYTAPASTKAIIRNLVACNTDAGDVVVSVYLDPTGTTFDDTTILLKDYTIPAGETRALGAICGGLLVIEDAGGSLGIKTDTVDVVVFTAFGGEIISS